LAPGLTLKAIDPTLNRVIAEFQTQKVQNAEAILGTKAAAMFSSAQPGRFK
jgi:hypothetical protein